MVLSCLFLREFFLCEPFVWLCLGFFPVFLWLMDIQKRNWLQFSGADDDFGYWSEKFEAYMHTKKLREKLIGDVECSNDVEKYSIWAELVQCLDKRSVLMLKADCKGDGAAAWKVLRAHFSSTETPRVMNLLERFTSLSLKSGEEMVDYLIRAEELSTSLDQAGEKVSNSLLVSVVLFPRSSQVL